MNESIDRRLLRILALLIAVVALAAGCSSGDSSGVETGSGDTDAVEESTDDGGATDEEPAEETTTTAAPVEEETTTTVAAGDADVDLSDGATVTVTDAGAEPRTELRLQVAPGQTERMVMSQTQEINQELDGTAAPSAGAIPMIIGMDLAAESSGGSLLTYTSVITDVTLGDAIDPALAAQIQPNLDAMVGVTTESILDDRGRVLATELAGTERIDPLVADTVDQMTSNSQFTHPLPEEPVGLGATWTVEQELLVSGLNVLQVTNYTVLSIEGTVVELAVSTEQIVPVGSEMNAGGAVAVVTAWQGVSTGTITMDLTSMVPASRSELVANQEFEFETGGTTSVLSQTIETQVEIAPG